MTDDPLRNLKDPLRKTGPEKEVELFRALSKVSTGFAQDEVINAVLNVLVNALRQGYASRRDAEARFDELMGRTKSVLLGHYDSVSGRRKGVFAFDQVIAPLFFKDKDTFN